MVSIVYTFVLTHLNTHSMYNTKYISTTTTTITGKVRVA